MTPKTVLAVFVMVVTLMATPLVAQNVKPGQPASSTPQQVGDQNPYKYDPPAAQHVNTTQTSTACATGCVRRSSPFNPPKPTDSTFVVDCDTGLDTGCTFRSGGPLVFTIKTCRVVGNVQRLKAEGLISPTARLDLPAFDVDFFAVVPPPANPERDRVFFNGHRMDEYQGNSQFLTGDNNIWKLNSFSIPIEWINFPPDPGPGGTPIPADNVVRIDIDTANTDELWCTAIDWAALSIDVARPVVFVHGILSNGGAWNKPEFSWINKLNDLGLPNSNRLNMGDLDSIQNNSRQISTEVANAVQRWGVDRVSLICHSKGGIDSRHFVEGNDSVERVIQLGTPNAGSPLADVAQGISTSLIGPIGTAIVNALVTPAGKQLTTDYMQYYNNHHGSNPKVKYTALAGDYDPDCSFFPFCRNAGEQFLLFITGAGDTIVPISSVHSLGYTENRFFGSVGDIKEATHTNLNASRSVFDSVSDRVKSFGTPLRAATSLPPIGHTVTAIGTISQGQVQTRIIQIDQVAPTSFSLLFPSGNLNLALISPSGQRFDPVTIVGNPNVSRQELEILGGLLEVYNFASAEAGNWTAEITAPSVTDPSGSVTYAVTGWLQNPSITLTGAFARANIHAGETLRLFGTLKNNGAPLIGASVMGRIGLPDATTQPVLLHDDGSGGDLTANDGIYTGDFTSTSQSGDYRVLFTASRASAPAFSREVFALATVSRSSSTFTGKFSDFGQDTDGNGLFNNLTINVGLSITAAANYRVFGVLTDARGNTHQANVQASLGAELNTVSLRFDGAALFNNRVDGPYRLTSVRLAEDIGGDILPVDDRTNAFQTAAYSFRSFEHGPLVLTGNGSAIGIDTNGNGLFDILRVGLEIDVSVAGVYDWSARLTDREGREIGFATNSASLIAGINTLQLNYAGDAIGRNGVNGPYFISSLLVFGPGGSLVASNAFTTGPFLATQFEGSCSMTISCPGPINVVAGATCPVATSAPVNFNVAVSGNCPVATFVCKNQNNVVVTSGSLFPVGTSAVNCTVTDTSGNTATCSFTVNVFSFCLQDETNPGNVVLVNANPNSNAAASYIVLCGGIPIASGQGTLTVRGCIGSLDHNKGDRRVHIQWDTSAQGGNGSGTAIVQVGPNNTRCQITDKNMVNNACAGSGTQSNDPKK